LQTNYIFIFKFAVLVALKNKAIFVAYATLCEIGLNRAYIKIFLMKLENFIYKIHYILCFKFTNM